MNDRSTSTRRGKSPSPRSSSPRGSEVGTGFFSDVKTLRDNARKHIDQGPITSTYGADLERVIAVLNEVLATELVCVLRYKRHYYMAEGINSRPVADEFLQHAAEEQDHADRVAERIVQLQGEPDFNPETLSKRSHSQYAPGTDLVDMIKEDLVAERIAIMSYQEIARWIGDGDPTTRRLIEDILSVEEEHADDMLTFLKEMDVSPNGS
jgi:bacterioferritin